MSPIVVFAYLASIYTDRKVIFRDIDTSADGVRNE